MRKCLVFFLPVVEVAQNVLIFGEVCFKSLRSSRVASRSLEFLKVIAYMIVRDELHDANSFPELFPQYSLFKYMFYCLESLSYPSFYFGHHQAIMSSLTRMIDLTPAAFFLSQFQHLKINDLREDSIH